MKKLILAGLLLLGASVSIAEDPAIKRQGYIERQRILVTKLLALLSDMKELRVEYDSQGFSGTFVDSDFVASNNNHISPAQFTSVIVSEQAISDLLSANGNAHYGNLYKIVK